MKLAPVRVFSCKHPLIEVSVKKELTVIILLSSNICTVPFYH